jgi:hypothetical protein
MSYDDLYVLIQHDHSLLGPWPQAPSVSLAPLAADLRGALRDAWQVICQLPKDRLGLAGQVAAQSALMAEALSVLSAQRQQATNDLAGTLAWSSTTATARRQEKVAQARINLAVAASAMQGRLNQALALSAISRGRDAAALTAARAALAGQAADAQADHAAMLAKATILATLNAAALQAEKALLDAGAIKHQETWTQQARWWAQRAVENQAWDQAHTGPWGLSIEEILSATCGGMSEGGYAGLINDVDFLTYQLIPCLHNYRNQVWRDIGLTGTGWETASNLFAGIGCLCLQEALIARWMWSLEGAMEMQVSFGPGGRGFPFHVKYGVKGWWVHAVGKKLGQLYIVSAEGGTQKRVWFVIKEIPIFFGKKVMREGPAWTCIGAALRAWSRGIFNWPWW